MLTTTPEADLHETSTSTDEDELVSYAALSEQFGLSEAALRQFVHKHKDDHPEFVPVLRKARKLFFTPGQVETIRHFMQHNTFAINRQTVGESLNFEGAIAYLVEHLGEFSKSLFYYYRNRYGKPYPDYFDAHGVGRAQARYLVASLDAFVAWVQAGKPESPAERIVSHERQSDGSLLVWFADGVHVLLSGDEASVSPIMTPDQGQAYIERAWIHKETLMVRKRREKRQ